MFVDYVKITVKAGDGGNGCVSFRREKYVPHGGPDGGDGGSGGSIFAEANTSLMTLMDLKYRPHYVAKRGAHGKRKNMSGRNAPDIVIKLPLGAVISEENGNVLADLTKPNKPVVLARGGKGGKGNQHFATPTNKAPRKATPGAPGEHKKLIIELKIIADVGLVGLPNAGKSTLLSALTSASPKVASYPFTTLHPNLGVLEIDDKQIVIADIPGLIEGAYKGVGLGHKFLRHIERTKFLIFILYTDEPPLDFESLDYQLNLLIEEIKNYSEKLESRPSIVVVNKIDLAEEKLPREIKDAFSKKGIDVIGISALKKIGLGDLTKKLGKEIKNLATENTEDTENL